MRLPPLPTIRDIVRLYKLSANRKLSQNFLLDQNLTRKIVRCAGDIHNGYVCEVGPGPGGITRSILEYGAKKVILIEKDQRFFPGLEMLNEASEGKVDIFHGDVLKFKMDSIFPEEASVPWESEPPNLHIIGNLPFNVSTPLIIKYLEAISNHSGAWQHGRVRLTLTFQKEVAERMAAQILQTGRSRLSVMCQHLCEVQHKFTIPGKAFVPQPEVDVGVVHFVPLVEPLIKLPFKLVEKVVRHTFQFRPKMCKRGIQTLFPPDRQDLTEKMFHEADVPPDSRPFMLTIEEFDRLCHVYKDLCDQNPGIYEYYFRDEESAAEWRKSSKALNI